MPDLEKIKEELKEALPEKFYNDLLKLDFIEDASEMFLTNSLINLDLEDLVKVSNDTIVGSISQIFIDLDNDYIIKTISDKEPNSCIINITSGEDLKIQNVEKLIEKLRNKFSGISVIFGVNIKTDLKNQIMVQALLLNGDYKEVKRDEEDTSINHLKQNNKVIEKSEKELLIEIALYGINNPISINNIQNQFGLGFNRTLNLLSKLESLGIISAKIGTDPRKMLIIDEEEIKNKINNMNE